RGDFQASERPRADARLAFEALMPGCQTLKPKLLNQGLKLRPDFASDHKVGAVVEFSRVPVDNYQFGAVFLGKDRKGIRGVNDQRRADCQEEIAAECRFAGPFHLHDRHRLAKGDRRGLNEPTAMLTCRSCTHLPVLGTDDIELDAALAIETL